METKDLLKQASDGTLTCSKCGATNMALKNVRVAMGPDGPKLDPSTYAECGSCNQRFSLDKLQKSAGGKSWWQFWK
jgi:transcription elongation factor Elf1